MATRGQGEFTRWPRSLRDLAGTLNAVERSVLLVVLDRAQGRKDGWAMSHESIALEAGTSKASARRATARLEALGLIHIDGSRTGGNRVWNRYRCPADMDAAAQTALVRAQGEHVTEQVKVRREVMERAQDDELPAQNDAIRAQGEQRIQGEPIKRTHQERVGAIAPTHIKEALVTELREAHRAAYGRDLTAEEIETHKHHDEQVIRADIEGCRYNTPPAGWSRPVRFFGGIVEDEALALLVDVYTLARGYAPDPDRYAQYMSYRQPDALRVIGTLTEKLRLDGIAPNAACCTEVYESLSPRAKAWADAGRIPDTLTEAR